MLVNTTISQINDNTLAILLGDININLLNENNEKVNNYLDNLFEKNFIPCISLPTRITDHSATIIDHILFKPPQKVIATQMLIWQHIHRPI